MYNNRIHTTLIEHIIEHIFTKLVDKSSPPPTLYSNFRQKQESHKGGLLHLEGFYLRDYLKGVRDILNNNGGGGGVEARRQGKDLSKDVSEISYHKNLGGVGYEGVCIYRSKNNKDVTEILYYRRDRVNGD